MKEPSPKERFFRLINLRIPTVQDAPVEDVHAPKGDHHPEEFLSAEDLLHYHLHSSAVEYGDKLIVGDGGKDRFPLSMSFVTYGNLRLIDSLERP